MLFGCDSGIGGYSALRLAIGGRIQPFEDLGICGEVGIRKHSRNEESFLAPTAVLGLEFF